MEIIKELQQNEIDKLQLEVRGHFDEGNILEFINKAHCYQVRLYADDFNTILINSSIEDRDLDISEYPTIRYVIDSIKQNPDFLNKTNSNRRLDGKTVGRYCDEFRQNHNKPDSFFLVDRDYYPKMNPKGLFYVRDGMHHLVAYGLFTDMKESTFPISGIYSSNKKRDCGEAQSRF